MQRSVRSALIAVAIVCVLGSLDAAMATPPTSGCSGDTRVAPAEAVIPVSTMPARSYRAAGLSAHFRNPAGSVIENRYWTAAPTRYIAPDDHTRLVAESLFCARDVEVDTWTRNGIVFLRKTDDGRAIYFFHNGEVGPAGDLEVGIVANFAEGVGYRFAAGGGRFHTLYRGPVTAAAYTRQATQGHRFTFGVAGFDIYARYNGVEFLRLTEYRHMAPGRIALQANAGYGFRDVVARTLPMPALASDHANGILDLRDFGLRSVRAVGTISRSSNVLTLDQPAAFTVGDPVIVEIGGEDGRGHRGTRGVGGTWPAQAYPSVARLRDDRSRPNGLYAWVEDSGDVYRWIDGDWARQDGKHSYYVAKATPLALQARIVAISGRELTLDQPAATSARGANVYLDSAHVFNTLARDPRQAGEDFSGLTPENITLRLPPGDFAIGRTLALVNHRQWTIEGHGAASTRFFSPRGTPSAMLVAQDSPRTRVRALTLQGNARDEGYVLQRSPNWHGLSETEVEQGAAYPSGVLFAAGSHQSRAEDLVVIDVFQRAVGATYADDVWASNVRNVMTDGLRAYVQWQFQWADARGGGCVDCSVESPWLIAGFEAFKSRDVHFIRPVGRNASIAMNAAGGFVIEGARITVTPMSQHPDRIFSEHNPLINITANIAPRHPNLALGGTIRDTVMVVQGPVNAENDVPRGIIVNAQNPSIVIHGGLYQGPDYAPPSRLSGPTAVVATGAQTVVEGFRVVGRVNPDAHPGANIYVEDGVVRDCVAEKIRVGTRAAIHR